VHFYAEVYCLSQSRSPRPAIHQWMRTGVGSDIKSSCTMTLEWDWHTTNITLFYKHVSSSFIQLSSSSMISVHPKIRKYIQVVLHMLRQIELTYKNTYFPLWVIIRWYCLLIRAKFWHGKRTKINENMSELLWFWVLLHISTQECEITINRIK
jgi:hypothetical protein